MSVVNKMLQDLEARQTTPDAISADYIPPPKSSRKNWYILLIVLLFTAIAYLWFIQPQWVQDRAVSLGLIDIKLQQNQEKTQSRQMNVAKKSAADMEFSSEATTNELLIVPASKIEVPLIDAPSHNEGVKNSTDTAVETTPILSATRSKALDSLLLVSAQQSAELNNKRSSFQALSTIENEDKKQTQSQASFSISDSSEKDKAEGVKQAVISALSEGNNDLAIRRLEELLRVQPDNIEARKRLAALLFAQKRRNQAENVLLQGITNHPLRSDLRLMLARLYMQKNDNDGAIKLLNAVHPDARNHSDFLAYRAALLQQNGHYEQAKGDYLQLIGADTVNAKWWLGLAITQDRLGQNTEALIAYRKAYNKEQLSPSVVKFVEQRIIQMEGAQ
jgi:MSHA biogenesis protein MshN